MVVFVKIINLPFPPLKAIALDPFILPRSSVQGGRYVIRKEAWSLYRTSSGVRLCWELEKPKGPKGLVCQKSWYEARTSTHHLYVHIR